MHMERNPLLGINVQVHTFEYGGVLWEARRAPGLELFVGTAITGPFCKEHGALLRYRDKVSGALREPKDEDPIEGQSTLVCTQCGTAYDLGASGVAFKEAKQRAFEALQGKLRVERLT